MPEQHKRAYANLNDATFETAISRSELYRLLGAGKIRAIKAGRSLLIDMESLRAYLAALPPARINVKAA